MHISTECYPAAKAGGMGDVVGALPLYLPDQGIEASVVIPKYKRKWFEEHTLTQIHKGYFNLGLERIHYTVLMLEEGQLGYPFYCIDIPGKFDREDIYLAEDGHGYKDEAGRNISFQTAVLEWLLSETIQFDALHCHDHMTGLITFFIKYCPKYDALRKIPTFFTIHNGQYSGQLEWPVANLFQPFDKMFGGLLEWDGKINSLAAAIKCAWYINTVSPSYMKELRDDSDTLRQLYAKERDKCIGILNGVDNRLWDPSTDKYLDIKLKKDWGAFKRGNKKYLLDTYNLKNKRLLIGFIGRFAYQKGADLLIASIRQCLKEKLKFNVIILGSGDKEIEYEILALSEKHPRGVGVIIAYDEGLARKIYAGSDFLIMPSRFEPCGLNQLYAMRYGSIPVVSAVGGLIDTVPDYTDNGNGIVIEHLSVTDISIAIKRSIELYKAKSKFITLRSKICDLDFSWHKSAAAYAELYNHFLK